MNIWQSLSGKMTLKMTSAEPEISLDRITMSGIPISDILKETELTWQFQINRRDYPQLCKLLSKQSVSVTVVRKNGLYWKAASLRKHPVLLLGFLLLLVSSLYLPTRVLFIEVSGNQSVPANQILDAARECGITFAASRRNVRSEKVKNRLLAAVPQLQWAGINTYGCRAVISVRERSREDVREESPAVSHLVAEQDGYILSQTVTDGTPMFRAGDTVKKGEILISGYTDCDFCIQATRASGEILAQTQRSLTAVMPAQTGYIDRAQTSYRGISLLLRKKRINLWKDSRISDTGCGRMYEEYFVSLPGGYRLPVAICIERYVPYTVRTSVLPESDARKSLLSFSDGYLLKQMNAGKIVGKQHQMALHDDRYILNSGYVCTEIIGKEQLEQIGDHNGKGN